MLNDEPKRPWWFIDADREQRRDTVIACLLVVPFAVVPIQLGWPYWSQWVAPVAFFACLLLVIKVRLMGSQRWIERQTAPQ